MRFMGLVIDFPVRRSLRALWGKFDGLTAVFDLTRCFSQEAIAQRGSFILRSVCFGCFW